MGADSILAGDAVADTRGSIANTRGALNSFNGIDNGDLIIVTNDAAVESSATAIANVFIGRIAFPDGTLGVATDVKDVGTKNDSGVVRSASQSIRAVMWLRIPDDI